MKVDKKKIKKAGNRKKFPDLKNLRIPSFEDLKNFDPASIDRKKAIKAGVMLLAVIILLRGCTGMKNADVSKEPGPAQTEAPAFADLTADDIMTGKIDRPYTGKTIKNIDLDKLVQILNNIVFIENTEPFPGTSSKGTYFTLYMENGTKITITAADDYLTINDAGWKVDAGSYNDLIEFATQAFRKK